VPQPVGRDTRSRSLMRALLSAAKILDRGHERGQSNQQRAALRGDIA
jgi:hypothetical protein